MEHGAYYNHIVSCVRNLFSVTGTVLKPVKGSANKYCYSVELGSNCIAIVTASHTEELVFKLYSALGIIDATMEVTGYYDGK